MNFLIFNFTVSLAAEKFFLLSLKGPIRLRTGDPALISLTLRLRVP